MRSKILITIDTTFFFLLFPFWIQQKKGKTAAIVHNTQNNRVDLEAQSERRSR